MSYVETCIKDYARIYHDRPSRDHRAEVFLHLDALARYRHDVKVWKADTTFARHEAPDRFDYCEKRRQLGRTAQEMAKQQGWKLP